jgi:hypothetical protein
MQGGEPAAGGRQVRGGGQRASDGPLLDAGHHDRQRLVQVRPETAGPLAQAVRVADRPPEQLFEELAADPVLRFAGGPADEQQERRH